jgi:hypothetical protein
MLVVLCSDPLEPARPDRSFQTEVDALNGVGLSDVLVDHDALASGDDDARVIRRVPDRSEPVTAVYRGWMMTPPQYRRLYDALAGRHTNGERVLETGSFRRATGPASASYP